ncbi:hypothetical protein Hanom_Chr14g01264571 [Helianthus anomalus]
MSLHQDPQSRSTSPSWQTAGRLKSFVNVSPIFLPRRIPAKKKKTSNFLYRNMKQRLPLLCCNQIS